jgi:ferredoxin
VSDFAERRIGRFTIRIDRNLCVGFGDCVDEAPALFVLADDGIVAFTTEAQAEEQRIIAACRACPVDALTAFDEHAEQIAP